eukprot:scaffold11051_cov165-Amphora_coffeaeformis.AAC.12
MSRSVMIEVSDPLFRKKLGIHLAAATILVGEYFEITIQASRSESVVRLDRGLHRQNVLHRSWAPPICKFVRSILLASAQEYAHTLRPEGR